LSAFPAIEELQGFMEACAKIVARAGWAAVFHVAEKWVLRASGKAVEMKRYIISGSF
jgi:hypothetical protein